jgi:DNA-binding Xre family transcriptional regulator
MEHRIIIDDLLHFLRLNQKEFSEKCGILEDTVSKIKTGKQGISPKVRAKIIAAFPQINRAWLSDGVGDMINVDALNNVANVSESRFIGQMHGGSVVVNGESADKDKLIKAQGEHVVNTFESLRLELAKFHEVTMKQNDYIERLVKNSYERNERNMERINKLISQHDNLINQQNDLIYIINNQMKDLHLMIEKTLNNKNINPKK